MRSSHAVEQSAGLEFCGEVVGVEATAAGILVPVGSVTFRGSPGKGEYLVDDCARREEEGLEET